MKRIVSILLILALCLCFPACSRKTERIQEPVSFYYLRAELTYGGDDSVICPQQAESAGHEKDLVWLLNSYFQMTPAEGLINPFPSGTKLVSVTIEESTANVVVSDVFCLNHDMDLTIACACITMTVMELTDVETVTVRTINTTLNGAQQIVMNKSCLLLIDNSAGETIQEE